MASQVKILQDIANQIKEDNQRGKERLPTSDVFIRKMVNAHNKSADEILHYMEILKEAHYIFIIEIVMPDSDLFVQGINGYVYGDSEIINDLKHTLEANLMQMYENMFYKKKPGNQIVKELYPKIKDYNNTNMGRALNEVYHLEEAFRTVTNNSFEYTESWKKEKLLKLIKEDQTSPGTVTGVDIPSDSFDQIISSEEIKSDINRYKQEPNSKWLRSVNQFSVQFLMRIHFRKYEFDVIRKLITTNKINQIEDFIFIRNHIRFLETMGDKDPILKYHTDKLVELRRLCQAKINIIRKNMTTPAN